MHDWSGILARDGHRLTRSRRAIIAVLQQTQKPLSPREILSLARQSVAKLDLVTVYRTLDLLSSSYLVRRIHHIDGCHAYLAARQGHHHAIICEKCGRAAEFRGDNDLSELLTRVERETGYVVKQHLLQLTGLCPGCTQAAVSHNTLNSHHNEDPTDD